MNWEYTFHALAVADAAHSEGLVDSVTTTPNDEAGKNLNTLLLALDHLGVHLDGVAHVEFQRFLAVVLRLDLVQNFLIHFSNFRLNSRPAAGRGVVARFAT